MIFCPFGYKIVMSGGMYMKKILKLSAILAAAGCIFTFSGCTLVTANPTGRWSFTVEDVFFNNVQQSHTSIEEMDMEFDYVLFKDGTGQIEVNGTPTYTLTYDYDDKGVTMHINDTPLSMASGTTVSGGTHDNYFKLEGDNFRLGAKMVNTMEDTMTDAGSGETIAVRNELTFTKKL